MGVTGLHRSHLEVQKECSFRFGISGNRSEHNVFMNIIFLLSNN